MLLALTFDIDKFTENINVQLSYEIPKENEIIACDRFNFVLG